MDDPVWVKLCGIRSAADVHAALGARPDAVGFICDVTHVSEDALTPDRARELSRLVAESATAPVQRVLVTHQQDPRKIIRLAEHVGVEAIQVHGEVSPQALAEVYRLRGDHEIVRAVHVTDLPTVLDTIAEIIGDCDVVLLDSRTDDRLGGTGQVHDWNVSAKIVAELGASKRVTLAGGLDQHNVTAAIDQVRPYGVDVNTGVDDRRGDKSATACAAFAAAARTAATDLPARSRREPADRRTQRLLQSACS